MNQERKDLIITLEKQKATIKDLEGMQATAKMRYEGLLQQRENESKDIIERLKNENEALTRVMKEKVANLEAKSKELMSINCENIKDLAVLRGKLAVEQESMKKSEETSSLLKF